jgi:hypothetical protein
MQRTRFGDEAPSDALLFIDADTRLDPSCLAATLALARDRDLDVLSLLSTLTTERWFERVAQPSAGMELVYQFPLLRCNGRSCTRPFANGQFMLFRRSSYEAIGGHEAVKDELLEDLALARLIAERGMNAGVFIADGILRCRMYESWSEFTRGWKRIYTEASRRKQDRLFKRGWRKRLTGSIMPVGSAASAIVGGLALGASPDATMTAAAAWAFAGGALGLLAYGLVAGIVLAAAKDLRTGAPTRWGGRSYVRESR